MMSFAAEKEMISKPSGQTVLLAIVVAGSCALVGYLLLFYEAYSQPASAAASSLTVAASEQ
jgi:hypothetical protein